jgi:arylsulfate sulfotransferase
MVLVLAGVSAASFNASGQVQLDGAVVSYASSNTASSSITVTNATGTGQNRLTLVGITWNANTTATTISSVTFTPDGGTATNLAEILTQQVAPTTFRYSALYSLTDPPSGQTGVFTVTFSRSLSNGINIGVENFMNVDPITPLGTPNGASATGTAPTVTLTGLNGDELVLDNVFIGGNPPPVLTPGGNQAQLWTDRIFNAGGASSTQSAANDSVTMSWTASASGPWAIVAVPIEPSVLNTNPPTVTINGAAGQASPTSVSPVNFTVVFSQTVVDFVAGDVTFSGTAGATTATLTGSGSTYNVAVSGMTSPGTVIASIAGGLVHNRAGITNVASTSTDNQVVYSPGTFTVSIVSGPTFTPATNAPLAGVLALTTDVKSRISVLVNEGTNTWERDFFDFATSHSETLLGFMPGRTYQISVTAYDMQRNTFTPAQPLTFVTAPLPSTFPASTVLISDPSRMEPGYTMFIVHVGVSAQYMTIMDNAGNVVWYDPAPSSSSFDLRQLPDGDLFTETHTNLVEINMLGQTVQSWLPPPNYPLDLHEGVMTDHGTILFLSNVAQPVSNFPSSTATNAPLVTTNVDDNPVVEISATNSALLNAWPLLPLNMLNPTRITYLTYDGLTLWGVDNEHANSIFEDTNDNSIIVSVRNQNAVLKFSRAGQLKWILGPPANWGPDFQQYLLTPVGSPFEWNYGQHAAELTFQGTIMMFDDGNDRASPYDPPWADQTNYSRGVEYRVDETNMLVSQVWDSTTADTNVFYSTAMGRADLLPKTTNVLVTFADITYINGAHPSAFAPNATMARIREMTHDPVPQVVFDISIFDPANQSPSFAGYTVYRSYRIPDLYAHPAVAVADLAISYANQTPRLQFSADPFLNYSIQASTDLINWTTLGSPVQEGGPGEYDFQDLTADPSTPRFYRVLTQQQQDN